MVVQCLAKFIMRRVGSRDSKNAVFVQKSSMEWSALIIGE